jgi:aspartyl-tRNA(Asn)/glutamyl-tRNA(Gln) amidotransferase subunit C
MLTKEQVEHVAKLARLASSEEERALYSRQLSSILSYVEKLNELDTAAVEPTSHVLPLTNVFREDRARPSLAPEQALANAPDRAGDLFRVPKIIGEKE